MSKVYQRPMSATRAEACEQARRPYCVCRCGGALHGTSHLEFIHATNKVIEETGALDEEQAQEIAARVQRGRGDRPSRSRRRRANA